MKIKEKGLTGKTAAIRRDTLTRPGGRGFNAFHEMAKGKDGAAGKDKPKPEIWLEFMGAKLRVLEEDGGSVKAEDVPHVKGATLKFVGCGGNASFKDLKVRTTFCDGVLVPLLMYYPVSRTRFESTSRAYRSSNTKRGTIRGLLASTTHFQKQTSPS